MPTKFASGKRAIAECDVCGQRYKLKQLRRLVIKTKDTNILACPECWNPDHPQLQLGMYPVNDPQALRNPRPDTSYVQSGPDDEGNPSQGSRDIQWGWYPVGLNNPLGLSGLVSALEGQGQVGTVTVTSDAPTPPVATGIVFDFVNGEYAIDGVSVTVEEAVEVWPDPFASSTFTYGDIEPGVGWRNGINSIAELTPAALSAIGSGPYTGTITILTDIVLGGAADGGVTMTLLSDLDEAINVYYSRNFGSPEDSLTLIDDVSAEFATPTGISANVPFDLNFDYSPSSLTADVNGLTPITIPIVTGPQTTITFSPSSGDLGTVVAIRRIEITPA